MLWKVTNNLTYLYKYLVKINRFCSRNNWFLMILAEFYQSFSQNKKLGQSGPKNCVFFFLLKVCSKFAPKSIHHIVWFQLQKFKTLQLLRGAHPPHTPPVRASAQGVYVRASAQLANAPSNHIPSNVEDGFTPCSSSEVLFVDLLLIYE